MKYDELKRTETGYLASNSKTFREYGKVLKYLKDRYDSYSQNCTSDEILFSDIAHEYIEKQKHEMMFVSDKTNYKLRIRYASQFINKDFVSRSTVEKLLKNYNGNYEFDEINEFLKSHYLYSKIRPEIIETIIAAQRGH